MTTPTNTTTTTTARSTSPATASAGSPAAAGRGPYLIPLLLALAILGGLTVALAGEGAVDVVAWALLLLPGLVAVQRLRAQGSKR